MAKRESGYYNKIAIWELTKSLDDKEYKRSQIESGYGFNAQYEICTAEELPYVKPYVIFKYFWGGEEIVAKLFLNSTQCNFGGLRHWFECVCGRCVGVLFMVNGSFACRHCHDLTYTSRKISSRDKLDPSYQDYLEILASKIRSKTSRYFYNNKPTKNSRRIFKLVGRV